MEKEEVRKGPWTEQEDAQLVFYVNLFGDRRWDFIAKVSGLKVAGDRLYRTGKSCRLRWVNYLHPGLKRGKMTPHEERLVLELHSKWGNRWSRIAGKLPGRTDNEIKNYWRTHMRKKAQERKKTITPSLSSSSNSSSSSSNSNSPTEGRSFYDTGGLDTAPSPGENKTGVEQEENTKAYSMDEIWKDIELSEEIGQTMTSPVWDFCPNDSLWSIDEEETKMLMQQMGDNFHSLPFYNHMTG